MSSKIFLFLIFNSVLCDKYCYDELGCFIDNFMWTIFEKDVPIPDDPKYVKTKLFSYSRTCSKRLISQWPQVSPSGSCFSTSSDINGLVMIIHGYEQSSSDNWIIDMVFSCLSNKNSNVIVVDWSDGSHRSEYLQAVSNTRIVGAQLSRFLNHLIKTNSIKKEDIHIIGHGLGARIAGIVANNLSQIGYITALDPENPYFESGPDDLILNRYSAKYVQAIYSTKLPSVPYVESNFVKEVGHANYYFNVSTSDYNCKKWSLNYYNHSIDSLDEIPYIPDSLISEYLSCTKGFSYLYYIEVVLNNRCEIFGKRIGTSRDYFNALTNGYFEKWRKNSTLCTSSSCSKIGVHTNDPEIEGIFEVQIENISSQCTDSLPK